MKQILWKGLILLLALSLFSGCSSSLSEGEKSEPSEEKTEVMTESEESKEDQKETEEAPDPKADDILNILMVGNSGSYYYCDELYEMLTAAGIKARVCNLYYSGCRIDQHLEWFKPPIANYDYYAHDAGGRAGAKDVSLQYALDQQPWDVITLQQAIGPKMAQSFDYAMERTAGGAAALYKVFRLQHPNAQYYWHEFWAFEVGFNKPDGLGVVADTESQTAQSLVIRQVGDAIAKANNAPLIPTGSAWLIARQNGSGNLTKDRYHDGETQGGQLLNACVWFEVLTGKSCLENTFKPSYELSDERIALMKNAAHQAVQEAYGETCPSVI